MSAGPVASPTSAWSPASGGPQHDQITDVLNGLIDGFDAERIANVERTHVLFPTQGIPGADGKVKIGKGDLKYNRTVLKSILTALAGKQCTSSSYSEAIHEFDRAPDWKLGQSNTLFRASLASPWAVFEGQVAHDMVSYLHKLKRNHDKSIDAELQELKDLVPAACTRRRLIVKSAPEAAEDLCDEVPNRAVVMELAQHIMEHNPDVSQELYNSYIKQTTFVP